MKQKIDAMGEQAKDELIVTLAHQAVRKVNELALKTKQVEYDRTKLLKIEGMNTKLTQCKNALMSKTKGKNDYRVPNHKR